MKEVKVGFTSEAERMKIFDVVPGSNQRLIQPQTVGKKLGAPMIYRLLADAFYIEDRGTYKNPIQSLGIMRRSQHTRILHMPL